MQKFGLDTVVRILQISSEIACFDECEKNSAANMPEFCFFRRDRSSPEKRAEIFKIGG